MAATQAVSLSTQRTMPVMLPLLMSEAIHGFDRKMAGVFCRMGAMDGVC